MRVARRRECQVNSASAWQTEAIGRALGRRLQPGDLICLSGELGAGKTVFSRGLGAGWGANPPLSSPTYNLAHEHERRRDGARLHHLDFYRVSGARDAETLSLHELLDSGDILVFEWPERVKAILPSERLWIDIAPLDIDERELRFAATGERHCALLDSLCQALSGTG